MSQASRSVAVRIPPLESNAVGPEDGFTPLFCVMALALVVFGITLMVSVKSVVATDEATRREGS